MPKTTQLVTFDEFRSSFDSADPRPFAAAARQQREHFRDPAAADVLLRAEKVTQRGWIEWPDRGAVSE